MIQACRLQQKVFKEVSLWSDQLGILTLFCLICAPQIFAFLFWTCNNKMWVCPCLYATSPHRKPLKSFLFKRQSPWPPCHSEPVPIRLLFEEGRLQGGGVGLMDRQKGIRLKLARDLFSMFIKLVVEAPNITTPEYQQHRTQGPL